MQRTKIKSTARFRIAVVGSQRGRVAKVISLLTNSSNYKTNNDSHLDLNVEYIACVATFDSYEDETGSEVRYLIKLEYHENEGKAVGGSSLATFFDEVPLYYENKKKDNTKSIDGSIMTNQIPGIAAIAIGCGIETEEDVEKITSFIDLLSGNSLLTQDGVDEERHEMIMRCIKPNEEFESMAEENKYYKSLDSQEKENVTKLETIGPGKMARFVKSIEQEIDDIVSPGKQDNEKKETDHTLSQNDEVEQLTDRIEEEKEALRKIDLIEYDPSLTRFACKKCRRILFSEEELEDPPHVQSKHNFSSRKANRSSASSNLKCESVFLQSGLDWMGDISNSYEGKITCFKCNSKLGLWKWAGNQCSCGTL